MTGAIQLKHKGGRPRRDGVIRDEHGRIDYSQYREDPRTLPAWNRYRDVAQEMALDPRMASQRGRMFYARQITSAQFEAANRWADLLEAYDFLILGRRRTPAPPALERLGRAENNFQDQSRIDVVNAAFHAAHEALLTAGKIAEISLTRLCRDEGTGSMTEDAIRGMQVLAVHFGLVKRKK